jgi:Flp pilus assembly secretin CpaC
MYSKNLNLLQKLIFSSIILNLSFTQLNNQSCEMVKLSYIKTDYAMGSLKALGYNVVEFEGENAENDTEFSFSPTSEMSSNGLTIIKMPENNTVSLSSLSPGSNEDEEESENLAATLGGSSFSNMSSGEPLQRLMVCYPESKFELFSEFYEFLKNEIDVAADQILIEALVIEIDSEKLNEFDLGLTNYNDPSSDDGQVAISTPTLNTTSGGYSDFLLQYSTGGFFDEEGNAFSKLLNINLQALISSQSAEILSKPSVLVLDGRQARIQVGRQIPITRTIAVDGFSESDVEYIPVGIILNLKPRVSEDKRDVTMQVETIITEVDAQSSHQNVANAPTINNRRVESFIRVANNTPFIIGGLISDKKSDANGKIPLLSKIPLLGSLFSSSSVQHSKKEVIVVITPHVISEEHNRFSRIIPKDSDMFDSVDNRLFPNSYRLKDADIFDLEFILSHPKIDEIKELSHKYGDNLEGEMRGYIQNGGIPGEDILIRRMLYNIIENQGFFSYVTPDNVIFFESGEGVTYLSNKEDDFLLNDNDAILLEYENPLNKNQDEFVQPSATVKKVKTNDKSFKKDLKQYNVDNDGFSILLSSKNNRRRLFETLILKEVLAMNPDLELKINSFKAGVEIQFPAPETIRENTLVIDAEVAKYFYEINDYYSAFQGKFNSVFTQLED